MQVQTPYTLVFRPNPYPMGDNDNQPNPLNAIKRVPPFAFSQVGESYRLDADDTQSLPMRSIMPSTTGFMNQVNRVDDINADIASYAKFGENTNPVVYGPRRQPSMHFETEYLQYPENPYLPQQPQA